MESETRLQVETGSPDGISSLFSVRWERADTSEGELSLLLFMPLYGANKQHICSVHFDQRAIWISDSRKS